MVRELHKGGLVHTLKWVKSREEFLKALQEFTPDIVLSDYKMPGFSAPEALEIIKKHSPHIPFVVVSGTIGEDVGIEMLKAGAADYIMKAKVGRLCFVIARALEEAKERAERKEAEEKLNQVLKEEIKSREILTSMLDDNNKIREELERKLKELRETQNMLIQSEKLASLGTMVSAMAHEVNNPLMIISGNAQLCLMEEIKSEPVKENIRIIIDQCNRAKDVMQRLLIFSKPSIGEVKSVDINAAVEFAVKLVEHQYSLQNISIVKSYALDLPCIGIDENRIHEVIVNLLKNAAEAMLENGVITIVTSQEGQNLRVDITDTGEGMSEEAIGKLFVPFFTTKEKGTGLGLAVCYGIIKAHGGELKFVSEVGKGTTATILLPLGGIRK
jgi:signal transduction histidine kinase